MSLSRFVGVELELDGPYDSVVTNTNQTHISTLSIDIVNYLTILNSFYYWTEVQCFASGALVKEQALCF